jgi:hypothetical protein
VAPSRAQAASSIGVVDDRRVGQHDVEVQVRASSAKVSRWRSALKPAVSPEPGLEVEDQQAPGPRHLERLAHLGDEQVRHDRGEP